MYHIKDDKRSKHSAVLLFKAFTSFLDEKPYADIKITEVIERAQVSRATFYRNYDALEDILRYECDQRFMALRAYILDFYQNGVNAGAAHPLDLLKPFLRFWYLDSKVVEYLLKISNKHILFSNIMELVKGLMKRVGSQDEGDALYAYSLSIRSNIIMGILEVWIANGKTIPPDVLSLRIVEHLSASIHFKVGLPQDGE